MQYKKGNIWLINEISAIQSFYDFGLTTFGVGNRHGIKVIWDVCLGWLIEALYHGNGTCGWWQGLRWLFRKRAKNLICKREDELLFARLRLFHAGVQPHVKNSCSLTKSNSAGRPSYHRRRKRIISRWSSWPVIIGVEQFCASQVTTEMARQQPQSPWLRRRSP